MKYNVLQIILSFVFLIIILGITAIDDNNEIKVHIIDIRECSGSNRSGLVFKNCSFWMVDRKTLEVNCTLEIEMEINTNVKTIVTVTRCPINDRNNCEKMPSVIKEVQCNDFFESNLYKKFTENVDNLEKRCPIKPGTYDARNVLIEVVRSEDDRIKIELMKGDYQLVSHYYILQKEVGCQYIEVQLDTVPKKRNGREIVSF